VQARAHTRQRPLPHPCTAAHTHQVPLVPRHVPGLRARHPARGRAALLCAARVWGDLPGACVRMHNLGGRGGGLEVQNASAHAHSRRSDCCPERLALCSRAPSTAVRAQ